LKITQKHNILQGARNPLIYSDLQRFS